MADRLDQGEADLNERLRTAIRRLEQQEQTRDHEPVGRHDGRRPVYPPLYSRVKPDPVFGWLMDE